MLASNIPKSKIKVLDVALNDDGRTVVVRFDVSRGLRRYFFKDSVSATYSVSVAGLPEGVLIIPFLSLVVPAAWVLDATVEVDSADSAFVDSLERIRTKFQEMYPEVPFSGDLAVSKRTTVPAPETPKNGVLFSGGIDSTATAVHHRNEPLELFSVISDRDVSKGFAGWISAHNSDFSDLLGFEGHVVRADLHGVFDAPLVCSLYKQHIHDWWAGVQHSIYFAGACAPLATLRGIGRFYIPSSHSVGSESIRWGSHPKIDNEISWGASHVIHDLYDIGRQGKIKIITDYVKETGEQPTVCVCEKLKDIGGKNCSKCEKCCRSMIGIALEGADPNKFGFRFDGSAVMRIKWAIISGQIIRTQNEVSFWSELQCSGRTSQRGLEGPS
jgi:hypothetical protein